MHIGMLVPEFPGQTHVFFWREACALRALGARVTMLSTRRPSEPCQHAFAAGASKETHYLFPPNPAAVVTSLLRRRWLRPVPYLLNLEHNLRQLPKDAAMLLSAADLAEFANKNGIEHIHAHSCADAAHVVAMARLLGGPSYSLHLHGDLPVYGTHHAQKMKDALFVAAAARSGQLQVIEDVGIEERRTCVMRMGVDTKVFPSAVDQTSADPLHVVTVGRLNLVKGHRFGLQALRQVIDAGVRVRYSIAGSGPHQAEIEAEIQRLGLREHVAMLGTLGDSAVADLLKTAHVFLLPSVGLGEASPVAVMEAMAAGLCVICSVIGGTPDMLSTDTDGFLVPQEGVSEIAQTLTRLANDPALRQRIGAAAQQRARDNFDARVLARRLLDTIAEQRAAQS
jgi:colanic acid/amylovoran biosynthesis glycosyltransferase